MLSITDAPFANRRTRGKLLSRFEGWKNLNSTWKNHEEIDLPVLSVKERLLLDGFLRAVARTIICKNRQV